MMTALIPLRLQKYVYKPALPPLLFTEEQGCWYYKPSVDYDIVKNVLDSVKIPVIANRDIDSAQKAKRDYGLNGLRTCYGWQGNAWQPLPWIFSLR